MDIEVKKCIILDLEKRIAESQVMLKQKKEYEVQCERSVEVCEKLLTENKSELQKCRDDVKAIKSEIERMKRAIEEIKDAFD